MSRLVAVYTWPVAGAGHFTLLCLHLEQRVQQQWMGGSRSCFLVLVAVPAPVGGPWVDVVAPALALDPRPRPRIHPPLPSRLDR